VQTANNGSIQSVAAIVDDMFFVAKIRGAVENAGRNLKLVKTLESLRAEITAAPPDLVIVDLNSNRIDPLEAIRLIKSESSIPIVAFVSHVETEIIRQATEAGCDFVLPRSAFSIQLKDIAAGDIQRLRKH
jgi:DNA-binding NarL/FixJ family response regulator